MEPYLLLIAVPAYLVAGLLLALWADTRPRWTGAFDHMGTALQWGVWLFWPLALPVALRLQARRRGWR